MYNMEHTKNHVKKMFYSAVAWGDQGFAEYLFFEYKELFGEYINKDQLIDFFQEDKYLKSKNNTN